MQHKLHLMYFVFAVFVFHTNELFEIVIFPDMFSLGVHQRVQEVGPNYFIFMEIFGENLQKIVSTSQPLWRILDLAWSFSSNLFLDASYSLECALFY